MLTLTDAVSLRPYQREACDATLLSLLQHRSTLNVLPTGTGKTRCFIALIAAALEAGLNVLVLVDKDALVGQTQARLKTAAGLEARIEKARLKAETFAPLVIGSVQTMRNVKRLRRFAPDHFDLVICDEAHHAPAAGWRRILDYFKHARIVGFTATPDRRDRKSLRDVFEDVAYHMTVRDALEQGWLVPPRQRLVSVEGLDYSDISKCAGELNVGELDAVVRNVDIIERMVQPTLAEVGDLATIVFCVTIAHAHAFAERLRVYGRSAEVVDKNIVGKPREAIYDRFRGGETQFLCNVGVLTEGFDAPNVGAVVMGRATTSRGLYTQILGRGMRTLTGVLDGLDEASPEARLSAIAGSEKSTVLVLDFAGNAGRHCLVHAAHALDPSVDAEVAERAERIAEEEQLPLLEALNLAIELAEEAKRRDKAKSAPRYTTTEIDPLAGTVAGETMDLFSIPTTADYFERRPSGKLVAALEKFGITDASALDRRQAGKLMDELVGRSRSNRATVGMVKLLVKKKVPRQAALGMSMAAARAVIDATKANSWRLPADWAELAAAADAQAQPTRRKPKPPPSSQPPQPVQESLSLWG